MIKLLYFITAITLIACNEPSAEKNAETKNPQASETPTNKTKEQEETKPPGKDDSPTGKTYSNKRFRNVTVQKTGDDTYKISGEGQIFEANFGWVVEDGHNEILKGHQMTDAGAPEWGKFNFTIKVKKERSNSTLTLVLFETSAKDGSRQYELPIVLE